MVGNLAEWVADWVPNSTNCPGWASASNDDMYLAGANTTSNFPSALLRGGGAFFAVRPLSPSSPQVRHSRSSFARPQSLSTHAGSRASGNTGRA